MKSIILNMSQNKALQALRQDEYKYLNQLNSGATITPIAQDFWDFSGHAAISTSVVSGYPLSRIRDSYSTTLEAKTTMVERVGSGYKTGGITIEMPASTALRPGQEYFNTIYININKLNKPYLENFRYASNADEADGKISMYFVVLRRKDSPTNYKMFYFTPDSVFALDHNGNSLLSKQFAQCNIPEGNILIDSTLLKAVMGSDPLLTTNYIIDIGIMSVGKTHDFSVSNIFIGNSFDFYLNEGYKFKNNNLSKITYGERSGKNFLEKNESTKSVSNKFEIMTDLESNQYTSAIFLDNKDLPIAFFPYCDTLNDNTLKEHSKLNVLQGGMYMITADYQSENSFYNVFDFELTLTEYK